MGKNKEIITSGIISKDKRQTQCIQSESIKGVIISDIGNEKKRQEDSAIISISSNNRILISVFDGVGGCDKGEYASDFAAKEILKFFSTLMKNISTQEIIKSLCKKIYEINNHLLSLEFDSKTTITIAIKNNDDLIYENMGDSRLFIKSLNNKLYLLTEDECPKRDVNILPPDLKPFNSNSDWINNCLGRSDMVFNPKVLPSSNIKSVIATTDGVTDLIDSEHLEKILNENSKIKNKSIKIIDYVINNDRVNNQTKNIDKCYITDETEFKEIIPMGCDNATIAICEFI